MTSLFDREFKKNLEENTINKCIDNITKKYLNDYKNDRQYINSYNEWYHLLEEWVNDYVGNINMELADLFLHKYCHKYNLKSNYNVNDLILNRKRIANILFNNIYNILIH